MAEYNPFENLPGPEEYFANEVQGMMAQGHSHSGGGKTTDVKDVSVFIPPGDRTLLLYIVIILYTIMVVTSLLLNSCFVYVLIKGVQSYKNNFFRIVWQIVIANLIASISNLITTIPVTYFLSKDLTTDYLNSVIYSIVNLFDNVGDQVIMFICLLIAVHRLCIFVFPEVSETVFTGRNLNILLGTTWLICLIITIPQFIYGCYYEWDYIDSMERKAAYQFTCKGIYYRPTVTAIGKALMVQVIVFPIISLICYLTIFIQIARQRDRNSGIRQTEKDILKQSIMLFVAFQISTIVSYVSLSIATEDSEAYLVRRVVNMVELLAATLTPLQFFLTSKELREGIARSKPAFMNRNRNNTTSPMRMTPKDSITKTAVLTVY